MIKIHRLSTYSLIVGTLLLTGCSEEAIGWLVFIVIVLMAFTLGYFLGKQKRKERNAIREKASITQETDGTPSRTSDDE